MVLGYSIGQDGKDEVHCDVSLLRLYSLIYRICWMQQQPRLIDGSTSVLAFLHNCAV